MAAPHEVLNAMGDASRMEIVWRLATGGPKPLGKLTQGLRMSRQGATKHLKVLEDVGVVEIERRGKRQFVRLQCGPLLESGTLIQTLANEWAQRTPQS